MQPSEFWRLPIHDFWAEMDSKIEEARKIKEMTGEIGKPKGAGRIFSHGEWEAARRKHAEKMKAKQ
jgi:hypothetical protein